MKQEIINKFKPTKAQLGELLRNVFTNNNIPQGKIGNDNLSANINDIRPIQELTNEERTTFNPTINDMSGALNAGMSNNDEALSKMSQDEINKLISEGKNGGSKTLDDLIKQMAITETNPNDTPIERGGITGAANEVDEKKQLFDKLVKKELESLLGEEEKPIRSANQVISNFQGGAAKGLSALSQYLGSSEGQNILGTLVGALGNKDMQIQYGKGANEAMNREMYEQQLADKKELQKMQDREQIARSYLSSTSPKGGASFKNTVDIAYAQGMIPEDKYNALINTSDYTNDTFLPSATLNKLLEPYLITQRQSGASKLAGTKHGYRMEEIGESAKQGLQKAIKEAEYKEELPSVATKTEKTKKEIAQMAGSSPMSGVQAVSKQITNFEKLFDIVPAKKAIAGTVTRKITGLQTPTEANFDAQRTLLFNKIARDLGGEKGVLSDADIKRIEDSLPTLYDSKAQKQAKLKAVKDLINIRTQQYGGQSQFNSPKIGQKATSKSGKPIIYTQNGWQYAK